MRFLDGNGDWVLRLGEKVILDKYIAVFGYVKYSSRSILDMYVRLYRLDGSQVFGRALCNLSSDKTRTIDNFEKKVCDAYITHQTYITYQTLLPPELYDEICATAARFKKLKVFA